MFNLVVCILKSQGRLLLVDSYIVIIIISIIIISLLLLLLPLNNVRQVFCRLLYMVGIPHLPL